MKKILKIVATVYLMVSPILAGYLANWFVNNFSHYSSYETMKIGSSFVPGAIVVVLALVIICLLKMWIPSKEYEYEDK